MALAAEQEFPGPLARAMPLRGWALAARGHGEEGRAQSSRAWPPTEAMGTTADRPYYLALLAEASTQTGQITEGLEALAEALAMLAKIRARWWEAELYRLRGDCCCCTRGYSTGRQKPAFSRPSPSPTAGRPSPWSYAPP